jgi:hypothetical protein
VSRGKGPLKEK